MDTIIAVIFVILAIIFTCIGNTSLGLVLALSAIVFQLCDVSKEIEGKGWSRRR